MGIVDINQETQHDVITIITTLQQLLEAAQSDNHKLKQSLSDQQHQYQKLLDSKTGGILHENSILCNKQEKLETDLYTKGQALDAEKKETQYWKRLFDDLEKSLNVEREEFDKDRHQWIQQETQLMDQIRLLKQQQQQQKDQQHNYDHPENQKFTAPSSHLISDSLRMKKNHDCGAKGTTFCSSQVREHDTVSQQQSTSIKPDHTSRQESTNGKPYMESPPNDAGTQDTILLLEKRITELKSDLEQQVNDLQQHSLENREASRQINYMADQISSMKQLNESLMEENEGYRTLLHEKTISGDFLSESLDKLIDSRYSEDMDYNKDEQHLSHDTGNMNNQPKERQGLNLADELALASSAEKSAKENELLTEIKTLQDENHALQLYMNKILLRIIESKHSENLLSIDEPNNTRQTTVITSSITSFTTTTTTTTTSSTSSTHNEKSAMDSKSTLPCLPLENTSAALDDTTISAATTSRADGDSWSHIFKRMGGGLGGWARITHSGANYMVGDTLGIEVEESLA